VSRLSEGKALQRFLVLIACLLSALMMSSPAQSKPDLPPISGSESVAYQDAVNLWLSGDDLSALRALSELAKSGNAAAQILLARIGLDAKFHQHVTARMARRERMDLLRQSGGLSGKSWLNAAQLKEPLAKALLQLGNIPENPTAIRVLWNQGEHNLALMGSKRLLSYHEVHAVVENFVGLEPFPPFVVMLIKNSQRIVLNGSFKKTSAFPDWFYQPFASPPPEALLEMQNLSRSYGTDPSYREMVQSHAELVESWTPLRQFCERKCADAVPTCIVAGVAATDNIFPFNSPTERLISNEVYWSSPRMEKDIACRLVVDPATAKYVSEIDACFVSAISKVN
jgi:hypothetical protein